jgi:hypothetical protein
MLLILQILGALSCDLLDLPEDLTYFSPTYDCTFKIEASGQFYAPSEPVEWAFEVFEDSWFRLTLEPKYFAIHTTFTKNSETVSKTVLSSSYGQLSFKLKTGSYSIQLDPDAFEEITSENIGCTQAYLYLNLALKPLSTLSKSPLFKDQVTGFTSLTDLQKFIDFSSFSFTDPLLFIKTSEIAGLLHSYNFSITVPNSEQKGFGITGLWKISFVLSKF